MQMRDRLLTPLESIREQQAGLTCAARFTQIPVRGWRPRPAILPQCSQLRVDRTRMIYNIWKGHTKRWMI